jgi:putative redox protein
MADTQAQVIVQEAGTGKFTQTITAGNHTLTADEPVSVGGNDAGPSPYDFILAGLGACTAMTVRMYANLKNIPLEKIVVALSHSKKYEEDCLNCEKEQAKLDHIDRNITLLGNLTPEQKDKLMEIANKCPVHRTLTSRIIITTTLQN